MPEPAPQGEDDDLELEVLPDGRVRIHARCRVGQDPAECEARVRAFAEALGVPREALEAQITPEAAPDQGSSEL